MKTAIINTTIILPESMIKDGVIVIEDGKIVDFGKKISTDGMEVYDANGAYTGPGLIDVHTHADGETFFTEDAVKAASTLLRHGVTDVLPALYFNMNADQLVEAIKTVRAAMESGKADNIIGLYMEAPYMNPKFGCNRESNPWKDVVATERFAKVVDAAYDIAKVWCIAPERENIDEFVDYVKAKNPNAIFSVAHSEAEPWQIERLMPKGLKLATHHTNATGTLYKYPECRTACVDETALYNDTIYTELICDKIGIHVAPYMLRLIKKIKGDDKIILIADAFVEHGPIPADDLYEGADDINFDFAGEIAGSKMILDGPCRNMMYHTGASLCQVFKYASRNPARMLGIPDKGEIKVGNVANLITVDADFNIKAVFLNGKKTEN
ncbi:MAG: amidohydrolase family protein [Clostridia bacterium]|nr:amidohydrolase family protein [Clostridia bacterium]